MYICSMRLWYVSPNIWWRSSPLPLFLSLHLNADWWCKSTLTVCLKWCCDVERMILSGTIQPTCTQLSTDHAWSFSMRKEKKGGLTLVSSQKKDVYERKLSDLYKKHNSVFELIIPWSLLIWLARLYKTSQIYIHAIGFGTHLQPYTFMSLIAMISLLTSIDTLKTTTIWYFDIDVLIWH